MRCHLITVTFVPGREEMWKNTDLSQLFFLQAVVVSVSLNNETESPRLVDLQCMVKCAPPNLSWKQSTCTELSVLMELRRQTSVAVNCEERCSTGVWLSASTCSGCLPCRDLLSLKCPVPGSGPSCLSHGAVGWSCQEDCIRPVRRLLARDFPWREGQTDRRDPEV